MNIVLVGAPGSGKGTACAELVKDYGFVHISTGDLFRANIKNETKIGKIAKEYINKGLLVPDEVVLDMLKDRLSQPDCVNGVLLDGYPRNLQQVKSLDKICNVDLVLYLNANMETVVGRLSTRRSCEGCKEIFNTVRDHLTSDKCPKCGGKLVQRDDDKVESIKKRLKVYYEETLPIVDEYKSRGIAREINTNRSQDISYKEIRRAINEKLKQSR